MTGPPFLLGLSSHRAPDAPYLRDLTVLRDLDLRFTAPITLFVGENGSGKSTLLETIATLSGLPRQGGGKNELANHQAPRHPLAACIRPSFRRRPRDAFFYKGDEIRGFGQLLRARKEDPDFLGNPFARYGGGPLDERSHGEAAVDVLINRLGEGLYLLDEPEAGLSTTRLLGFLRVIARLGATGGAQFFISTHSPIAMTLPGADIWSLDGSRPARVELEEVSQYQLFKGLLDAPHIFWSHLLRDEE